MQAITRAPRRRKRSIIPTAAALAVALGLVVALAACGTAGPDGSGAAVSGVVAGDASTPDTVSLTDCSVPAQERTASVGEGGSFMLDVSGLTPPYLLTAEMPHGDATTRMRSIALQAGPADVNPLTDAAVEVARSGADAGEDDGGPDELDAAGQERRTIARNFRGAILRLRTVLQPLFELYGVPADPTGPGARDGLRAMFRDVRMSVDAGQLLVTNVATGEVIFSSPVRDVESGSFFPEHLPAPGAIPPPAPPEACTYGYSAWGACQPDGTQTRTVTSSSPEGCTGTPVLSQPCTYVPPPGSCTYGYSTWGACQPDGTRTRTVTSSSPEGCTGTPVLSQPCTYVPPPEACTYGYSAWGACQPDGTQTRTVTSSSPEGCTGTPVLSQPCTYVPPPPTLDGAALYGQKCSGCHGPLATSEVRGVTAQQIVDAGMTRGLTAAEVEAVADALR